MHTFHISFKLYTSVTGSSSYLPKSIFERLPSLPLQKPSISGWQKQPQRQPKHRDYRYGPISIDWVDFMPPDMTESGKVPGKSGQPAQTKGPVIAAASFTDMGPSAIFGSTALSLGTVHIFRDSGGQTTPIPQPSTTSPNTQEQPKVEPSDLHTDGTLLAVLAVPSYMTPPGFLTFIGPAVPNIVHLRIIRDSVPNRSIALIKFRTSANAQNFAEEYNGQPFNSLEPEICHVVHVVSVSIETPDLNVEMSFTQHQVTQGVLFELPTCPVCLERMDTAITGLVTVPCSHTFHCMCLRKWGDSRCPICRYSQALLPSHSNIRSVPFSGPSPTRLSLCFDCSSASNLWICLICGNVGCGRYRRAHAHAHYQLTGHLYALELETQRVWDYAGDAYVHRLIQNKADGKLVELPSASSMVASDPVTDGSRSLGPGPADALAAAKAEAIGIEYSYLLTSQLDSQRAYYEEQAAELKGKIEETQAQLESVIQHAREQAQIQEMEAESKRKEEESKREAAERERIKADKKAEKAAQLARRLEKELKEERAVSEGLMKNLSAVKQRVDAAEQERAEFMTKITEMEEQLRDVMFFLEAKDKIEAGDGVISEAAGGSLELPPQQKTPARKKKSRK